jgi:hypothetical protein
MSPQIEQDFPPGHPARFDYKPDSPEAKEWARRNVSPLGERDFPVDHAKAADTPGNTNHLKYEAGVDPLNPHREAFTGRTPSQVEGVKRLSEAASKAAIESPALRPIDALVVNKMLDARRSELKRDMLTPDEYEEVLRKYHAQREAQEEADRVELDGKYREEAINFLVSRKYSETEANETVDKEGALNILRAAGIR